MYFIERNKTFPIIIKKIIICESIIYKSKFIRKLAILRSVVRRTSCCWINWRSCWDCSEWPSSRFECFNTLTFWVLLIFSRSCLVEMDLLLYGYAGSRRQSMNMCSGSLLVFVKLSSHVSMIVLFFFSDKLLIVFREILNSCIRKFNFNKFKHFC